MKTALLLVATILLAGVALCQTPAPAPTDEYTSLIKEGNTYLKAGDNAKAIEAYQKAAAISPNPAQAYWNICAVLYNVGDTVRSVDACRVAIRYNPNKADAYFVLGSVLFANAAITDNGKVRASEELRGALNKCLELAPDGPHAADTKEMLKMLN